MAKATTCLAIAVGLCITTHQSLAFQLKSDIISNGGTKASSGGYISEGTLSQFAACSPWLTSSGFQAVIGFWHPSGGSPGIEEYYEDLGAKGYVNSLYACNPNPVRNHAILQYSIAQEGMVMLEIYNTLGQRVASLVDGTQPPGVYTVTWRVRLDGLPAGVYFYRLKTADYTKVRKLVVVY